MSIHHDIQKSAGNANQSVYEQETVVQSMKPPIRPPQPPSRPPRTKRGHWFIVSTLTAVLVIILTLGSIFVVQLARHPANQATPVPTVATSTSAKTTPAATPAPTAAATSTSSVNESIPTTVPGVALGPQACPAGVADPARWATTIEPYSYGGPQQVKGISCANLMGNSSLQSLVTARGAGANDMLDVYVFTDITKTAPTLIFQMNGLIKGDAKISGYSTVMTAEVNPLSSVNTGKSASAMTVDLFREFKWSGSAGTLVQTVFPGIFPDLTRYQAEAQQITVEQEHQPWRLNAATVARALVMDLLTWPPNCTTTLLSGGGSHDASAVVRVKNALSAGGGIITVTLWRLEGNTNGGTWEATAVSSSGLSITSPTPLSQFLNPVKVMGTGSAFEGQIGQVILLDHLYTKLGQANATGAIGMGQTTFSSTLYFQSTFPQGSQEGVLTLSVPSQANGSVAAEFMEKVLINGTRESPFAVLSVDLKASPSNMVGITCGSTVPFTYIATFHVQVGTAGGTIQFLYTWNNGRASQRGSVTVSPGSPGTATFTFSATGRVGPAFAFPGVAQVDVTSPDVVKSPQVVVTGICTA